MFNKNIWLPRLLSLFNKFHDYSGPGKQTPLSMIFPGRGHPATINAFLARVIVLMLGPHSISLSFKLQKKRLSFWSTSGDTFLIIWTYSREASFPFSKRSNSAIFRDCNFHYFLGLCATFFFFLSNAMPKSAEISRVCLPIPHWQINYEDFVKLFWKFLIMNDEIFNDEFYFKISYRQWFFWILFVFEMQ